MASLKASERSINLKATEEEDNEGYDDNEEEDEMKNLREEHRISSVWKTGGDIKNEVLWKLEKLFSSFVTKLEDEELNEVTYETLLSAHKSVTRATKYETIDNLFHQRSSVHAWNIDHTSSSPCVLSLLDCLQIVIITLREISQYILLVRSGFQVHWCP